MKHNEFCQSCVAQKKVGYFLVSSFTDEQSVEFLFSAMGIQVTCQKKAILEVFSLDAGF